MSSNDDDYDGDTSSRLFQTLKKRRIQRACDICRRKKIRCDGVQMPGNRCSNCIAYSFHCTYVEAAKKRGPPKGYVESLETRLEKLDKLLRRLCPDKTLYKELEESIDNWTPEQPPVDPSPIVRSPAAGGVTPLESLTSALRIMSKDDNANQEQTEDDEETTLLIVDNLKRLELEPHEYRFFGKSSGAMLVRAALELKSEYTGNPQTDFAKHSLKNVKNLRKEFWTIRPWEKKPDTLESPEFEFPESDLAKDCIELYFNNVNIYLPLLHRPTFEKDIREGLHLTNDNFASVYLLVCAVGSRYSLDPRVRLEGVESFHSAGWKWFEQVQMVRKSLLSPPTVYDLQRYSLSVQFLQGSSAPQSCWTMVGIGIRLAQDVGAHRRKLNNHTLTAEDETWKRAFWVLVCMDRIISSSLGRPCAIQDEDFDLDLPVDCDDEYWDNEDPEKRFKQPPNKPSQITSFILYLKLYQILAFSLRTIYSINKSKILLGFVGPQWEQLIVAELDSALNKWVDSVPDHLRWDPNREDMIFFNQSVTLYAAYYHIQILIHRPFIPSPSKPSPLSFPSLAICTNAARSCSHVVDIQRKRNISSVTIPQVQICMSVFTAGIVLLLSIWGGKRSGLATDPNKEMEDVHKCMQVLRNAEKRWHSAGRLWDILYELASVGELPLPQPSPPANKRERDSETPISAPPSEASVPNILHDGPRNIAGSKRVNQHQQQRIPRVSPNIHAQSSSSSLHNLSQSLPIGQMQQNPASSMSPEACFALPVYSNELGRIPLHGGITFSAQAPIPSQPHQQHQLQQHSNFWYTASDRSSSSVPSSSGSIEIGSPSTGSAGISPHHTSNGYTSMGEMSSMTQGYGAMDDVNIAAGVMFDTMGGSIPYTQRPSTSPYAMGGHVDPSVSMLDPSSSYRTMSMDATSSGHRAHQNQPLNGQHNNDEMYAFVDNDTIAMWSNAPTGFEFDEWGTFLTNVSELTQGHGHPGSGDPADFQGHLIQSRHG